MLANVTILPVFLLFPPTPQTAKTTKSGINSGKAEGGRTFPKGGLHVNSHNTLGRCEKEKDFLKANLRP